VIIRLNAREKPEETCEITTIGRYFETLTFEVGREHTSVMLGHSTTYLDK
jgi:hypothetical protein